MSGKSKLTDSSKLVEIVIEAIEEKKGEKVVILNLQKINQAVSDYFVVCHGNSSTQVAAIADEVEKKVKEELGESPFHTEGVTNAEWVLLDYVNVVVHIFQEEQRNYYDLEGLWADAV